ncbi:hypothetical protein JRQ81_011885 [Phrynocephalus forsythii]|uniref:Noncompact myelin-associated protein n=1 Tax=Phrynocephalus forsythii TaxID=171643 RepID=A0A9Q0X6M2_9SAUR|nr:hypothetical protein JRQ81_011885 [Phrynocephalus forsythii]
MIPAFQSFGIRRVNKSKHVPQTTGTGRGNLANKSWWPIGYPWRGGPLRSSTRPGGPSLHPPALEERHPTENQVPVEEIRRTKCALEERVFVPNGNKSGGTSGAKMTTAVPVAEDALSCTNVTTKSQEHILYQSSGAIVAAIVVGIIIIFTVVLLLLKMYNRRMRAKRELEPKNVKVTVPSISGQDANCPSPQGRHTTVTFVPMDIHVPNRRP